MTPLLEALAARIGTDHVLAGAGLERYEQDWRGRYAGHALGVVRPGSTAEVAAVVRHCAQARSQGHSVSLVPQGGNTGLVGGGVPDGSGTQLVLSLERMRAIRSLDVDDLTLTAEAGCLLRSLQVAAEDAGLLYPVSLASEGSCTLGGNLATNAGGTQVLRYGNTRALCLGLEVVTAAGEVWSRLEGLRKDNTGYDLRDLHIGSEGTLGVITAAAMTLHPLPRTRCTGWAATRTLHDAVALLRRLRAAFDAELVGYEAMNGESLDLVAHQFPAIGRPWASPAGTDAAPPWSILFELASAHEESIVRAAAERVLAQALEAGIALDVRFAGSLQQGRGLWAQREAIPLAQAAAGLNIKHDVAVPVSSLARFVEEADAALARLAPGGRHITFGHLGDGNLHYNLQAPPGADAATFLAQHEVPVNDCVHDIAMRLGGTFSAEHGIGRLKRAELARRRGGAGLEAMRAIKRALDPAGLFNPGVMLGRGDEA